MERIKYLRNGRVPFACLYSRINKTTGIREFGWSLCSRDDKFVKKVAVEIARKNLNKVSPHSIHNDLNLFIDGFRTAKIRKKLRTQLNNYSFVEAARLIIKHKIEFEVYSNQDQLVGFIEHYMSEDIIISLVEMWVVLELNFKFWVDDE